MRILEVMVMVSVANKSVDQWGKSASKHWNVCVLSVGRMHMERKLANLLNTVLIFCLIVFLLGFQDIRLLLEICERQNIDQESSLYNGIIKLFTLDKTS